MTRYLKENKNKIISENLATLRMTKKVGNQNQVVTEMDKQMKKLTEDKERT